MILGSKAAYKLCNREVRAQHLFFWEAGQEVVHQLVMN